MKKTTTNKSVLTTSLISLLVTLTTFLLGMKCFPAMFNYETSGFKELMSLVALLFFPALFQLSVLVRYWKYHTH